MAEDSASRPESVPEHHVQQELCRTRLPYRKGRKETAIKVYTINDESVHLIVCSVPALGLFTQLKSKFAPYGDIKQFVVLPDYPNERFTETFHVHYQRIQSARVAKRFLDGYSFYGGLLHVFYAPEFEALAETRQKLEQRQKDVLFRIKRHKEDPTNPQIDPFVPEPDSQQRKKKKPALPQTLIYSTKR